MHAVVLMLNSWLSCLVRTSNPQSHQGVVIKTAKVGTEPEMVHTCLRTNEFDWGCDGELSDRGDCGFCGDSGGCMHTHHLSMPTPMAWSRKNKGRLRVILTRLLASLL